jgi:hypothetical protein
MMVLADKRQKMESIILDIIQRIVQMGEKVLQEMTQMTI